MKLNKFLYPILIVLTFHHMNLNAQWTQTNGPIGGNAYCLTIKGTDLFAGAWGGVFRSTNNGVNWKLVNSGITNPVVLSIASNETHLFAGTYGTIGNGEFGGGVFKSTNNGLTWDPSSEGLPLNADVNSLAVSGINIFAGCGGGVFRSTNNGTNWFSVNNGIDNKLVMSFLVNGSSLYAATNDNGVYVSINDGNDWTPINSGMTGISTLSLTLNNNYLFAGSRSNGVYRSTNNGLSWIQMNSGLTNLEIHALFVKDQIIFAGTGAGIYVSSNNGVSWSAANTGNPGSLVSSFAVLNSNLFAGFIYSLEGGVYSSTNNGANWNVVNNGYVNSDINTFQVHGSALYAGTYYGVHKTTNNGDSWVGVNNGLPQILLGNPGAYIESFASINTTLFAGTYGSGVYRTTDGGLNWNPANTGISNKRVLAMISSGSLLFASASPGIYLSTNNGTSWGIVSNGLPTNVSVSCFALIGTNLFAGTNNYGVYVSTNNGTSWSPVNTGLTNNNVQTLIVIGTALFAGTYGGGVFVTTNYGTSWNTASNGLPNGDITYMVTDNTNLFAGTYYGVYQSSDFGANWNSLNAGLTSKFINTLVVNGQHLFAGTYMTGAWRIPLISTTSTWQSNISISDNCSGNVQLTYGTAANATNGLDPALGEAELPPVPPSGVFDSRFILPVSPSVASLKDFRPDNQTQITWRMTFQPGSCNYPINFSWNSASLPEGSFYLKDEVTGTIVNINMKTQNSYSLANTGITSLKIQYSYLTCQNVDVFSNWNLVSIPVLTADMNFASLFPGYLPPAYKYNNGYEQVTSAQNGKGYWAKFSSAQSYQICGTIVSDPIPLAQGWNIIGPYNNPIQVNQIVTTPPGIISTSFYGMTPTGYQVASTLEPGKGYWVKSSQNGSINTSFQGNNDKQIEDVLYVIDVPFSVNDGAGSSGMIYAGSHESGTNGLDPSLNEAELPPLPPMGVFDVRFNLPTNPVVSSLRDYRDCQLNAYSHQYEMQYQVGSGSVINLSWDLPALTTDSMRIQDMLGGVVINNLYLPGPGSFTVSNPGALNKLKIFIFYKPNACEIVPVELTSFTATHLGTKINLQWSTATETNNMGFEIEKSLDQNVWTKLGFVSGKGTTTEITNYSYSDDNIINGVSYYRLKQLDFDGSINYSPIVSVDVISPSIYSLSQNYPNPFNPTSTINYSLPKESFVTIIIYNILGDEIAVLVNEKKQAGSYSIEFNATNLTSGVYFYRLQADSFVDTKKMTLIK